MQIAQGFLNLRPLTAYRNWQAFGLLSLGVGLSLLVSLIPLQWGVMILLACVVVIAALYAPMYALIFALILGPSRALLWSVWPDLSVYPGQIFFGLFVLVWILRGLFLRGVRLVFPSFLLPLLVYVGIGTVSLWGSVDPLSGVRELIKWLQLLLIALLVLDCCRRRHVGWLLAAALVSGVFQAMIGLWEYGLRGSGPEAFEIAPGLYRGYGTFEQPNPFGGFMGMVWPLAFGIFIALLSESRRFRAKATIGLSLVVLGFVALVVGGLVVSYSRGAWVGALAAVGVIGFFGPRRRVMGLAVVATVFIVLMGLASARALPVNMYERMVSFAEFASLRDVSGVAIDPANFSVIERLAHWQAATRMATANPWLGVGLGNFQAAYDDYRLLNWHYALGHAHSVYLNAVAETGFVGLGAYLLVWASVFLVTLRAIRVSVGWRRGVSLGLLGVWTHLSVHNLVDYLFVNNLHLYLGALLGVLAVINRDSSVHEVPISSKDLAEVGG